MGLVLASAGAILAWSVGFKATFTEPKLICIVLGLCLAWYHKAECPTPLRVKQALWLYWLCFLPSYILSKNAMLSTFGIPGIFSESLMAASLCSLGFFLALKELSPEKTKRYIFAAGTACACLVILQKFELDPWNMPHYPNAFGGTLGSHTDLGALMVVLLAYTFNPFLLLGILACGSRGAILGAVIVIIFSK